ncbi:glycoside hydrolase family 76 protein [Arthrobacter glacialis]|uniref:glycoside hydrolase family 76 protein n=1 Tax=Arthrobacter glacialis TaxID=1664 RepID=UPI000CD48EA1|nr:glycoside hydrolase family 76 protein [Arthrobacter glacialis]POH61192.1 glycosyl hydrolase [Arthrobacter glacialis]
MTGNHFQPTTAGATAAHWAALAEQAGSDVNTRFGHRLMGLPGTWLGAVDAAGDGQVTRRPRPTPQSPWNYWWQAHYLDAMIDAAHLALSTGKGAAAAKELQRAQRLLRGIMIRNFLRFPNYFYDDMAWLALAAARLNDLHLQIKGRRTPLARFAVSALHKQLHLAHDMVLGGGIYWSRKRDFKNTPANGPAALHFTRMGEVDRARSIVEWLRSELFDPELGLYVDGIHPSATGRDVENTIYTYNQGPILAALLELGQPEYLDQTAGLIDAVARQLRTPGEGIRLEPGGGDGSLFTGILCRYLALAAREERLPAKTRETASDMVRETAAAVAGQAPEQLSAAVQRWSIFAAAATCPQPGPAPASPQPAPRRP